MPDAKLELERPVFAGCALHRLPRPRDIIGMLELRPVRAAGSEILGRVASDTDHAVADELHRPLVVIAAPVRHAGQAGDQCRQAALALAACGVGLAPQAGHLDVRLDPGDQFARAERLDEVVIRAGLHVLDARFLAGAGREQDDRHFAQPRIGTQRAQQAEAIQPGHHDIAEHEVGRVGVRRLQGGLPVGNRLHVKAPAQQAADVLSHVGIVIRPENAGALPCGLHP